jgi:hypothetical protein
LTKGELAILRDQERQKNRQGRRTKVPKHKCVFVLMGDERRCHICRQPPPWTEPEA